MTEDVVIGREPTRRELIICAMVGCILYFDDLEVGEISRVEADGEWFGGHVELDD